MLYGPVQVSVQDEEDHPDGSYTPVRNWHIEESGETRYLILDEDLTPGRRLRLEGYGVLSTMSTDAGTTEVSAPRTQLIVARAAQYLFEQLAKSAAMQDRDVHEANARFYRARVAEMLASPAYRSPRLAAASHKRTLVGI